MADGLLLLHAFPLGPEMWEPQAGAFSNSVPTAAPALPGFDGSAPADPATWMDAAADRAAAALDAAGIDRAVVCGLSMGGYVAFAFWRRHPARTRGLVLANTRSGADDEAGKGRRRDLAARLRAEGNGFLADNPPPLLSEAAPPALHARVQAMIRRQPAETIAAASLAMAARVDSTPGLAGITVPTLVITASADTLIPPQASAPMAQQVPGAVLATIAGAGHLSNLEAPEEFTRLLRQHLARCGVTVTP
ncbi:MAG: alpha/beta fold hydrolase [Dehalococcoidia bacterium]|nr:alpha/beta fold hydrolase [Dehalococcoidia bacterium]